SRDDTIPKAAESIISIRGERLDAKRGTRQVGTIRTYSCAS
ncbi:MAG: hypothetical protein K0R67_64, partial [Paenibacillus sp.]|nr:hypothetical protein [Paenibacillus sp.]